VIAVVTVPIGFIILAWVACCLWECIKIGEVPDLDPASHSSTSVKSSAEAAERAEENDENNGRKPKENEPNSRKSKKHPGRGGPDKSVKIVGKSHGSKDSSKEKSVLSDVTIISVAPFALSGFKKTGFADRMLNVYTQLNEENKPNADINPNIDRKLKYRIKLDAEKKVNADSSSIKSVFSDVTSMTKTFLSDGKDFSIVSDPLSEYKTTTPADSLLNAHKKWNSKNKLNADIKLNGEKQMSSDNKLYAKEKLNVDLKTKYHVKLNTKKKTHVNKKSVESNESDESSKTKTVSSYYGK